MKFPAFSHKFYNIGKGHSIQREFLKYIFKKIRVAMNYLCSLDLLSTIQNSLVTVVTLLGAYVVKLLNRGKVNKNIWIFFKFFLKWDSNSISTSFMKFG